MSLSPGSTARTRERARYALADLLSRQAGVIGRRQALALGMSPSSIQERLNRGEWWPVHPGVYLNRGHPRSADSDLWAAVIAVPGSALASATAVWWWAMTDRRPGRVDLVVPHTRRPRAKRGIVIVRRTLEPIDLTHHRGLPITAKPLSALDAAVAMGRHGPAMLDRALQRFVQYDDVLAAHHRHLGRHGSARAGELLRAAGDRAAAESERVLIKLLTLAGISGWTVNRARLATDSQTDVPDFTFEHERVLVYVDGWAWHHQPDRFGRDRRRQNALLLEGWTVLRFTWFDLTQHPERVIAQIRQALAAGPRGR